MSRTFRIRWVWCVLLLVPGSVRGDFLDDAAKAAELIDTNRLALARAYLDPLLADPGLSSSRRSLAYYLRGVTFSAESHYVSAALDYTRALEYDSGNVVARAALAQMYDEGLGVEKNPEEAVKLSKKAARAGHVPSMFYVGNALLTGRGANADLDKARFWLKRAAEADHLPALVLLASTYRAPLAPEPDLAEARRLYELAASRGSAEALAQLASIGRGAQDEATSRPSAP